MTQQHEIPFVFGPLAERIHSVEWHEEPWILPAIRDAVTDILHFGWCTVPTAGTAPANAAVEMVADVLRRVPPPADGAPFRLVDLCAGSGGPTPFVVRKLNELAAATKSSDKNSPPALSAKVSATLTDLYPHPDVWAKQQKDHRDASTASGAMADGSTVSGGATTASTLSFESRSVDATKVPEGLPGVRTLCGCFHHFQPEVARKILSDAVAADDCDGIVVMELVQRSVFHCIGMAIVMGLFCFVVPLFRSNWSWARLFWTYVIPALPFVGAWDAVISCTRAYTAKELAAMASTADPEGKFEWEVRAPRVVPFMVGSEMVSLVGVRRRE